YSRATIHHNSHLTTSFLSSETLTVLWTTTRELVTGLVARGVRVTLVSFGDIPLSHQTAWMDGLRGLQYRPTGFGLDWMQEREQDVPESAAFLTALIHELKPDVLHLNQLCYGNLKVRVPRIVVAHGDLVSWWKAVHGHEPNGSRRVQRYRQIVTEATGNASGLAA